METQTHTVFLGEVVEAESYGNDSAAMTYAYYHKVIRGKPRRMRRPTFLRRTVRREESSQPSDDAKKTGKWICQVCGYVYEGEELPADFKCPICGQGRINSRRWNDRTEPAHLTE